MLMKSLGIPKTASLILIIILLLTSSPFTSLGLAANSPQTQGPDVEGPTIGPPVVPVSFDGDVRGLPQVKPPFRGEMPPARRLPPREQPQAPDPVRQSQPAIASMPSPSQSFKGLDLANWGAGWPPDTNGDVGPNHYIQTVNTSVGIYSKAGTQMAAFTYDTLFAAAGTGTPCDNNNQGDPIVLYDQLADRWIVTDFAWSNINSGPFYECIAVSKTGDPVSGGWWLYGFLAHSKYINDYPKLGLWPDGIYMSANLFSRVSFK